MLWIVQFCSGLVRDIFMYAYTAILCSCSRHCMNKICQAHNFMWPMLPSGTVGEESAMANPWATPPPGRLNYSIVTPW